MKATHADAGIAADVALTGGGGYTQIAAYSWETRGAGPAQIAAYEFMSADWW